jgi:hypothetical protein
MLFGHHALVYRLARSRTVDNGNSVSRSNANEVCPPTLAEERHSERLKFSHPGLHRNSEDERTVRTACLKLILLAKPVANTACPAHGQDGL